MNEHAALTVVFATCDRAPVLAETLGHLSELDRKGLLVDFIVVDNNSRDNTAAVVESFRDRLPIRYLFEPQRGKNRALNLALNHGTFHPLVVFTDDDVKPATNWLQAIVDVSRRWPRHKVFGGRIVPAWPSADPPAWVHDAHIIQLAFAAHDRGAEERPYEFTAQPFGPNFWLRREVLTDDVHFDVNVGPGTGTLGDEVMFLHRLQRKGFEIIYSPLPVVEHCIQAAGICEKKLEERALMVGRIGPNMYGLCRPDTLARNPQLWRLMRHIRLLQARLALAKAKWHPDRTQRITRAISPLINIGYNTESLRLAKAKQRS
jgi:glycosyltransferase involved in cell wall biosynthesis